MNGPLDGVKIIDLSVIVLGPFATQILADFGAEVIKVESPEGDTMREIGPRKHKGMAPNYLAMNRNKRSIVIDLHNKDALDVLKRLISDADVLYSNLRPASMERLGLSYEQVSAINPRIIYCVAVGFGEHGRYAGKPAFDDLIQGAVGLPSLMERVSGTPQYLPTNLCDRIAGLTSVYAITTALYARERTGRGQSVEVPMFEVLTQFVMSDHLFGHTFDPPIGEPGYTRLLVKGRAPFKTRDGHICALIYLDKHWRKFCEMIGRPDMITDSRFKDLKNRTHHVDELNAFLSEELAKRTSAEWLAVLGAEDLPVMPMHSMSSIMDDPHLNDVKFFSWIDHPTEGRIRSMGIPVAFSDTPGTVRLPAPLLGENTREILREAGYSSAEIDDLLRKGAVRETRTAQAST